jgi:hypothetical protein
VLAPFANKTVAYNGMYGCLPGTFRVAGLLQYRARPQRPDKELRFYNDGTIIQQHGDYTQTGDFFPALQQLAGTTWQQIAAGGPDAYKVDCVKIEKLWRDWFTALYTSAMEQGYGTYLLPYLAREVHGEWRLGANASGIWSPAATDWSPVPLVTPGTFKNGALATPKSRTPACTPTSWSRVSGSASGDMGPPMDARRQDRRVHRPAALALGGPRGPPLRPLAPRRPAAFEVPPGRRRDHHPGRQGRGAAPAQSPVAQPRLRLRPPDRGRRSSGLRRVRRQHVAARPLHRHAQAPPEAPRAHAGRVRDRAPGRPGVRGCAARRRGPDHADRSKQARR